MHADLREALIFWRELSDGQRTVLHSEHGGAMTAGSIANWFAIAYRKLGLDGCSSHSGRRTFITRAARLVHIRVERRYLRLHAAFACEKQRDCLLELCRAKDRRRHLPIRMRRLRGRNKTERELGTNPPSGGVQPHWQSCAGR